MESLQQVLAEADQQKEVGFIGSSSSIHDKIPDNMSPMTTPEQASEFVRRTGVDVLAPAMAKARSASIRHGLLPSRAQREFVSLCMEDPARTTKGFWTRSRLESRSST